MQTILWANRVCTARCDIRIYYLGKFMNDELGDNQLNSTRWLWTLENSFTWADELHNAYIYLSEAIFVPIMNNSFGECGDKFLSFLEMNCFHWRCCMFQLWRNAEFCEYKKITSTSTRIRPSYAFSRRSHTFSPVQVCGCYWSISYRYPIVAIMGRTLFYTKNSVDPH